MTAHCKTGQLHLYCSMTYPIKPKLYLPVFALLILFVSCSKQQVDESKKIISCSLKKADGSDFASGEVVVAIQHDSVLITVPAGTELNGLIPVINIKGVTISPASGAPQNFNFPIVYTVTAENGSTAQYVVV